MKLSRYSDYAIRILVRLAITPDELVATPEIAERYGLSYNHLNKIVTVLAQKGFIEVKRGRNGGIRLAQDANDITIGRVVRGVENVEIVECHNPETNTCIISAACRLTAVFHEAAEAFLSTLDGYTLADILHQRRKALGTLLGP